MRQRICFIDYLRCIGLILVIAAHVFGTSTSFFQMLFGCNVSIMVIVSGYCSVRASACSIIDYYKKRIKQMVIHPWCFFGIYFFLVFLISRKNYPYTITQIIKTFLFMDGIGYTWIIAVFILIAIITPIFSFLNKVSNGKIKYCLPVFYWIFAFGVLLIPNPNLFIKLICYLSGYTFLAFLVYFSYEDKKNQQTYLIGSLIAFVFCFILYSIQSKDVFDLASNKYPPTLYYISYGSVITLLLFKVFSSVEQKLSCLGITKIITILSKMSFDIYLWHIFGLFVSEEIDNVWVRFIVVLSVAIICAKLYNCFFMLVSKCISQYRSRNNQ